MRKSKVKKQIAKRKKALDILHKGKSFGYVGQKLLEEYCLYHKDKFKNATNSKKEKIGF